MQKRKISDLEYFQSFQPNRTIEYSTQYSYPKKSSEDTAGYSIFSTNSFFDLPQHPINRMQSIQLEGVSSAMSEEASQGRKTSYVFGRDSCPKQAQEHSNRSTLISANSPIPQVRNKDAVFPKRTFSTNLTHTAKLQQFM